MSFPSGNLQLVFTNSKQQNDKHITAKVMIMTKKIYIYSGLIYTQLQNRTKIYVQDIYPVAEMNFTNQLHMIFSALHNKQHRACP